LALAWNDSMRILVMSRILCNAARLSKRLQRSKHREDSPLRAGCKQNKNRLRTRVAAEVLGHARVYEFLNDRTRA
jgi:hypothetical protein